MDAIFHIHQTLVIMRAIVGRKEGRKREKERERERERERKDRRRHSLKNQRAEKKMPQALIKALNFNSFAFELYVGRQCCGCCTS